MQPDSPLLWAQNHLLNGEHEAALEAVLGLFDQLSPEHREAACTLGWQALDAWRAECQLLALSEGSEDDDWDEEEDPLDPLDPHAQALLGCMERTLDHGTPGLYRLKALCHQLLGRHEEENEEALEAWEDGHRLDPKDPQLLHGLAQSLESHEYGEDAHQKYMALYHLDADAQRDPSSLRIPHDAFLSASQQAWEQLSKEWSLDTQPVGFEFQASIYPDDALMDASDPHDLMDPYVGLHVAFHVPVFDPPTVQLHLFQRNIERDLEGDEQELAASLDRAIRELLETCLSRVFDILDDDPEEDW